MKKYDLVIRLGGLGDVIMSLGLLNALSKSPSKKIFFLTHNRYKEIFELLDIPNVKPIFINHNIDSSSSFIELIWGGIKILKKLAFRKYEDVFLCHQDKRYLKLLALSSFKKLHQHKNSHHYFGLDLVNFLKEKKFEFPELNLETVERIQNRIVLFPGGDPLTEVGKYQRMWPVYKFVDLAKELTSMGYNVVICGSKKDGSYEHFFKECAHQSFYSNSLNETLRLLKSSFCAIAIDSGPMHLTILSGTKLIALFGPTDWVTRIPNEDSFKNKIKILNPSIKLSCQPCYDGKTYLKCNYPLCMNLIEPVQVIAKIKEYENSFSS